jgi:two-component system, OmpR family, response regulator
MFLDDLSGGWMTRNTKHRSTERPILLVGTEQPSTSVLAHWSLSRGLVPRIHRSSRRAARDALDSRPCAVVIIGSGLDVPAASLCRELVREGVRAPIVIVGGPGDSIQSAFDAGAQDFVTSVLHFDQLFTRIGAWTRRPADTGRTLSAGPLVLDCAKRTLGVGSTRLRLTPAESDLLAYLIEADGRVVSERELATSVLRARRVSSRSRVEFHLSNLRKKLGSMRPMLETVRGEGYRIDVAAPRRKKKR